MLIYFVKDFYSYGTTHSQSSIPHCRLAGLDFAPLWGHLPSVGWVGTGVFQVQPSELACRVAWGTRWGVTVTHVVTSAWP